MHLKATDPQSEQVVLVKVNDKVVKLPVELDTEEGWVDCVVPDVNGAPEGVHVAREDCDPSEWVITRLHGQVEVIWK